MDINKLHALVFTLLFVFSSLVTLCFATKKPYVVYLGEHSHGPEPTSTHFDHAEKYHHEFLGSFLGCKDKAKKAMIYSHKKHINAFSALLDPQEAEEISKHKDVISVFQGQRPQLYTTNSWEFLGMEKRGGLPADSIWKKWDILGVDKHAENPSNTVWGKSDFGQDIIIANVDSGVYPQSEMFSDSGMGPIPEKWKGRCRNDEDFDVSSTCNRKLISVRSFYKSMLQMYEKEVDDAKAVFTSIDIQGHGTHTLSTAGGGISNSVNLFGYRNGSAKGGLPNARVASYKIIFDDLPPEISDTHADVVEAHDEAIHDGVDVLSVSTGCSINGLPSSTNYFANGFAIGSLHAVRKGVVVVAAAGNMGPRESEIDNIWPWVITVGGSSIDRKFSTRVQLGNNQQLKAASLSNSSLPEKKPYPLIFFTDAAKIENEADAIAIKNCAEDATLYRDRVEGKIVVFGLENTEAMMCNLLVRKAGGVGMIVFEHVDRGNELIAESSVLPTARVTHSDGLNIITYMNSTENPVAYFAPPTVEFNTKPAPVVASFSSRGPNPITPEILKPDIIAPGVEIIAASPVYGEGDTPYVVMSGSSMATPHVAGVVGLLKAIHPEWSPAMIKSAIMTTASLLDNTNQPIKDFDSNPATPFSMGAGHIQPNKAVDPGLVYDITNDDYLNFLCAYDLKNFNITKHYNVSYNCPESYDLLSFNYPSVSVPMLSGTAIVTRTVKNVGTPATYAAKVVEPLGISVTVEPKRLVFTEEGEEKSFKLILRVKQAGEPKNYVFGKLEWSDGVHNVLSPIVVKAA